MLKELGQYKNHLYSIFVNDENTRRLLLGENYAGNISDLDDADLSAALEKQVLPHLYMEQTVSDVNSYLFFETYISSANSNIKNMKIVVQAVCHKDITAYPEKSEGYYGLRYDVLSQYVEELLCPTGKELKRQRMKQFGIGGLELQNVDLFSKDYYIGHTLTFQVPTFR